MRQIRATDQRPGRPPLAAASPASPHRRAGHARWRTGLRAAPALAACAVALGGCVPAVRYHEPRPVPTATSAPSIDATAAALAGEWDGEYDGALYGRRGALRLALRPIARVVGDTRTTTLAGSASGADGAPIAVDSARVSRGRVVLWLAPYPDPESGNTVQLRLDGALAGDTLGGRLRGEVAATVTPESRGSWRVVRARRPAPGAP